MGFSMPSRGKNHIRPSNPDKLAKTLKNVENISDKLGKGKRGEALGNAIEALLDSYKKVKHGNTILSLATHLKDAIVHDGERHIAVSSESKSKDLCNIYRTEIHIGKGHNRKINSYLNGPTYEVFEKVILKTSSDFLESKKRKDLKSICGANQRNFTFFDSDSFLCIADIKEMTSYNDKHYQTLKKQYREMIDNLDLSEVAESLVDEKSKPVVGEFVKKFNGKEIKKKYVKYYAGLLSTRQKIKIINRMPVYNLSIIIHLVRFNSYSEPNCVSSIDDLMREITNVSRPGQNLFLERLSPENVKKVTKSANSNLQQQIVTTLNVNLTGLESFKQHCTVLNSWKRELESGDQWNITLNHNFKNGVYLNKLYEINQHVHKNAPLTDFFVLETYGDQRAGLFRKEDAESFFNVYSPCMFQYDYELSYKHLSESTTQDEIVCYQTASKNREFEDETYGSHWYPDRQQELNVNFEDIDIDNNNTKSKFKLEMNANILENQNSDRFENFMKKIAKIDPEAANTMSEDDRQFIGKETLDEEKEDQETGLRGSNPPYEEDEHR